MARALWCEVLACPADGREQSSRGAGKECIVSLLFWCRSCSCGPNQDRPVAALVCASAACTDPQESSHQLPGASYFPCSCSAGGELRNDHWVELVSVFASIGSGQCMAFYIPGLCSSLLHGEMTRVGGIQLQIYWLSQCISSCCHIYLFSGNTCGAGIQVGGQEDDIWPWSLMGLCLDFQHIRHAAGNTRCFQCILCERGIRCH